MSNKIEITIPEGHEAVITGSKITFKPLPEEVPADDKYPKSVFDLPVDGTWYIDDMGDIEESLHHGKRRESHVCHLSTKSLAIAFKALIQLKELCDSWNKVDSFSADWNNGSQQKYCINRQNGKINKEMFWYDDCILHFKSPETRDLFYNRFQTLIELAKELL